MSLSGSGRMHSDEEIGSSGGWSSDGRGDCNGGEWKRIGSYSRSSGWGVHNGRGNGSGGQPSSEDHSQSPGQPVDGGSKGCGTWRFWPATLVPGAGSYRVDITWADSVKSPKKEWKMIRDWWANFWHIPPPEGVYVRYVLKPVRYQVRYGDDGEVITEELPDFDWPKGAETTSSDDE